MGGRSEHAGDGEATGGLRRVHSASTVDETIEEGNEEEAEEEGGGGEGRLVEDPREAKERRRAERNKNVVDAGALNFTEISFEYSTRSAVMGAQCAIRVERNNTGR